MFLTWKWVKDPTVPTSTEMTKIIRMRLVLRRFMDSEAYSIETFAGTARRTSQRILASEAACHPDWIIASIDVDKACLKGYTHKELAAKTGEPERQVYFTLPPGSAAIIRQFKGY